MKKEITLTLTKKQLKMIVLTMGIALDTDCKAMNNLSDEQLDKLLTLYNKLETMRILPQPGTAEYDAMYESDVRAHS